MATVKASSIIKLVRDHDPENPRDQENRGVMVCAHRRYRLGDSDGAAQALEVIHKYLSDRQLEEIDFDANHVPDVERALEMTGQAIMLPLYLYDHSGITMRTVPFGCPWDSGKVGFIFISKENARSEFGWKLLSKARIEKLQSYLKGEVEDYNHYLTGDMWGFQVIEDDEVINSCWGFFGDDPIANGMLDHLNSQHREMVRAGNYQRSYA